MIPFQSSGLRSVPTRIFVFVLFVTFGHGLCFEGPKTCKSMGRNITTIIALAVLSLVSLSAFGQEVETTGYGYRLNQNRNLRFTEAERVHTEITLGARYGSSKGVSSFGGSIQATRVWTPKDNFGYQAGVLVSSVYAGDFGALADILAVGGIRFGNKVYFGLDALVGTGQMALYDESTNGTSCHCYYNSQWRVKVGGQASLNFRLSQKVTLGVFGRYLYSFNDANKRSYQQAEGWTALGTVFYDNRWSAGLSLTFNIMNEKQISGDNCWTGGVYTGYSFLGNEGWVVGAEMNHFKRVSARGGRVLGFGSEQIIGDDMSTNSVFGKAGYQILPWGASSPVVFEFGAKAGIGEYVKAGEASTESGSFYLKSAIQTVGAVGKAYVGINFHFGRHSIKLGAEGGYHTCFNTSFEGEGYTGEVTTPLHGWDASVTLGYTIAF